MLDMERLNSSELRPGKNRKADSNGIHQNSNQKQQTNICVDRKLGVLREYCIERSFLIRQFRNGRVPEQVCESPLRRFLV